MAHPAAGMEFVEVSADFSAKLPTALLAVKCGHLQRGTTHELADREGFELREAVNGISKLLTQNAARAPSSPPDSPYLPPEPQMSAGH